MLKTKKGRDNVIDEKHRCSAALFERGQWVIPGGNTRLTAFQKPYPMYCGKGAGTHIFDADGNRYVDFLNNFTSLIHGHAYPAVVERLRCQIEIGLSFSGPTESEVELAELLCARVPYFDQVRFMNSGTEAVMYTIKAACALTGRPKIAKFEGAYHGGYDPVEVSLDSGPDNWGEESAPNAVPLCQGVTSALISDTIVLPFNDIHATRQILEVHKDELAAVLIDPLPQRIGLVPIERFYLEFLRDFTSKHQIILITDEVMSFRLSHKGGISRFGVEADLCAFGKIIGGGLPIGAVAGPSRFMAVFDPTYGKPLVPQSGTFSANPMSMVAGIATMQGLSEETFEQLEHLGNYARATLREAFDRGGMPYCVTGMASTFRLHMHAQAPRNYREAYLVPEKQAAMAKLIRILQDNGMIVSPTCQFCLSTPMTQDHIDEMVSVVFDSIQMLREI